MYAFAGSDDYYGNSDAESGKLCYDLNASAANSYYQKDNKQEILLNIQQNFQTVTTQRLEEKIQKLQKQLSDLKLSNKNMKTQLTRVNVLKVSKGCEAFKNSLKLCSVTVFAVCFSLNLKSYFTPIKIIYIILNI